jgi:hypothetical protein
MSDDRHIILVHAHPDGSVTARKGRVRRISADRMATVAFPSEGGQAPDLVDVNIDHCAKVEDGLALAVQRQMPTRASGEGAGEYAGPTPELHLHTLHDEAVMALVKAQGDDLRTLICDRLQQHFADRNEPCPLLITARPSQSVNIKTWNADAMLEAGWLHESALPEDAPTPDDDPA